jgi:hypothetical protein
MKVLLLLSLPFLLSASTCKSKSSPSSDCFKGKLEIKAACMNYTIRLIEGNIDTSLIAGNWVNENTGKSYKNVFALGSRCSFPSTIKEGDEFYFTIDSSTVQNCAVCLIYYPVPSKRLSIKVLPEPCHQ